MGLSRKYNPCPNVRHWRPELGRSLGKAVLALGSAAKAPAGRRTIELVGRLRAPEDILEMILPVCGRHNIRVVRLGLVDDVVVIRRRRVVVVGS